MLAVVALARAFPRWFALLIGCIVLTAIWPAIFAALVAHLITILPAAARSGSNSPAAAAVISALAGIALVLAAQEITRAAYEVVRWALYRRYEEHLIGRVIRAALSAGTLDIFERPDLAAKTDRAVRIAGLEPGDLVDGVSMKWPLQAQGLAAAVLVATVSVPAAAILFLVWILVGNRLQANMRRSDQFTWEDAVHAASYTHRIGLRQEWAKEVRIFGLAGWLSDRYGRQTARILAELAKARKIGQRPLAVLLALVVVVNAAVIVLATRSDLSVGAVVLLLQGMLGMSLLADQSGDDLIEYGASRVPVVLELEHLVARHATTRPGTATALGRPTESIVFEEVTFGYPESGKVIFDRLNLEIQAGTSLGIVGLNGAGKTTLIKLLTGLEVPQSGRILIDGTDLRELDQESWRKSVAAIFQDFVHYEMSARDNIGLGAVEQLAQPSIDREIERSAVRAGADAILDALAHGLDTTLSARLESGVDLSGGQWQRIALARSLMAVQGGARVLVLDEPTAQLDVRAEADLYDRFLDLTAGLTSVVISHRFSTIRRSNRIIVLDRGQVTEDGSHEQLLAADGTYARMFRKQAMRFSSNAEEDIDG
ncbi:ATP-binding cassette subfamily B protein [Kribbella sp. VKM Ac-2571]|uniref:ABC transporter ATP-binding protein n=1 Tax=Kribbella sp. VKM Ac-2571 TaxID=2512222 RepID=UPI0010F053D6|nr:ABC transporter ATP-binding protein [Kribbella sp. VKM Ac-2571]TDO64028.1 ATP-binding cassette subfamily B protein [Kribbella sp. VKM Ac-2571]